MASIAIVGPGAIGTTVAATLAQKSDHQISLCARSPVQELVVETPEGVIRARLSVFINPVEVSVVDWVLIATKAYDVEAAARWLAPLVGQNTRVAVLQNGVEHRERFAPFVAPERLVPVIVDIPAERSAPGHVRQHRYGTLTVPDDAAGRAFVELFSGTPIEARTDMDFATAAWRKLAINSSGIINTLTLKPFGITADEGIATVMRMLVSEVRAVGNAEGATLSETLPDEIVAYYRAQAPQLLNSMHSDRLAGRPLEIDARDGVVVRLGKRHGIPTPWHRALIALLQASMRTDL